MKNNFKKEEISCKNASNKIIVLMDLINHCVTANKKVIVFSSYTESLDYIANNLEHKYYRLDGKTKMELRFKQCEAFNNSLETKVFLISTRAGGEGITLTGASRLILLDTSWNPSIDGKCSLNYLVFVVYFILSCTLSLLFLLFFFNFHKEQSIHRMFRLGQKNLCFVYRIIAGGTMEPGILRTARNKEALSSSIIDDANIKNDMKIIESLNADEVNEIYNR